MPIKFDEIDICAKPAEWLKNIASKDIVSLEKLEDFTRVFIQLGCKESISDEASLDLHILINDWKKKYGPENPQSNSMSLDAYTYMRGQKNGTDGLSFNNKIGMDELKVKASHEIYRNLFLSTSLVLGSAFLIYTGFKYNDSGPMKLGGILLIGGGIAWGVINLAHLKDMGQF
jgi:hypothetical protein